MIQADDPRLKTAEGWVALGAPKNATRWVGPHERPWETHANGQRFVFDQNANGWFLISIEDKVPIHPEHTIISRPASDEEKVGLTLEPMTDWNGNEITDHPENEEYKALLKLSRKFGLGTSLTINIAPGVCSIHDNHGDEFRFPIERAQEVIESWAIVEAARVL
jgi:hypothetical protein